MINKYYTFIIHTYLYIFYQNLFLPLFYSYNLNFYKKLKKFFNFFLVYFLNYLENFLYIFTYIYVKSCFLKFLYILNIVINIVILKKF